MIIVVTRLGPDPIMAAGCTCCGVPEDGVLVIPQALREPGESYTDMLTRIIDEHHRVTAR